MFFRAVLAVAALAVAAPAFAQDGQPAGQQAEQSPAPSSSMAAARQQVRKACAADLKTYCSDLPQGGRMGQCLRQNFDKLSPDCKTQLEQMRALRREQRPQ